MELDHGLKAVSRRDKDEKIILATWKNIYSIDNNLIKASRNQPQLITLTKKRLQQLLDDINTVLSDVTMTLAPIATGNIVQRKPEMTMGLRLTNVTLAKRRLPMPDDDFFGVGIYNEKYVSELQLVRQELISILKNTNFSKYKVIYWRYN